MLTVVLNGKDNMDPDFNVTVGRVLNFLVGPVNGFAFILKNLVFLDLLEL
jgi:hypothetical protein